MKKLFFLPISFVALLFFSCTEDGLSPLPVKTEGQFIKLEIRDQTKQLDLNNINTTAFGGTLSTPGNNIVKYDLYVRRSDGVNGQITGDYVLLQTITSFPFELSITPAQIAEALGIPVTSLNDGDFYRFLGYSYDAAGTKTGYLNLSRSVQVAKAVQQGYRFNTELTSTPDDVYDNRQ
jgi:hypothetical protein